MVVIKIAPFAALDPYKAAAAGPFKIDTFSMSSWLMSTALFELDTPVCKAFVPPPLSIGTPSITKSGWLEPVKVVKPLIKIAEDDPTIPFDEATRTPATLPANAFTGLVVLPTVNSSAVTDATA